MVLIEEKVPVEMIQYHEPPTIRPDPPRAIPLLQPRIPTRLPGNQKDRGSQFQVGGYNPCGTCHESVFSLSRSASADLDDCRAVNMTLKSSRQAASHPNTLRVLREQQSWAQEYVIPADETQAGAAAQGIRLPHPTLSDYQTQFQASGYNNKSSGCSVGTNAHSDYEMQLRLLEQQKRSRLMLAQEDIQATQAQKMTSSRAREDYETQLWLLEEQNKQRRMQLERSQDDQMQLMLLESQNKKRPMLTEDNERTTKRNTFQDHQIEVSIGEEHHRRVRSTAGNQQTGYLAQRNTEDHKQPLLTAQGMNGTSSNQQRPPPLVPSGAAFVACQRQLVLLEMQKSHQRRFAAQERCQQEQQERQRQFGGHAQEQAEIDVERQYAAIKGDGTICSELLSCRYHSVPQKRSVRGRSAPFDDLLFAQRGAGAAHDKEFQLRPRLDDD